MLAVMFAAAGLQEKDKKMLYGVHRI